MHPLMEVELVIVVDKVKPVGSKLVSPFQPKKKIDYVSFAPSPFSSFSPILYKKKEPFLHLTFQLLLHIIHFLS